MYRAHFGLREKPFQVVPTAKVLFASETHDEGRARILYGIRENRGFCVVYGGIGLGKTTTLLSVLEEIEGNVRSAFLFNPVSDFHQLLRMICAEFGIATQGLDEVELLHLLNRFLVERLAAGETCVLIVDEAQNLSLDLLEQLRTLSNLQSDDRSLLQIVLSGQPELFDKLRHPRLLQLRQRVGVWHEIQPLDPDEAEEYLHHRLRYAGCARPKKLLSTASCEHLYELSGGVPRVINQLADTAFVIAYGKGVEEVLPVHINEAASEMRLDAPAVDESAPRATTKVPSKPRRIRPKAKAKARKESSRGRWWAWGIGVAVVVLLISGLMPQGWIHDWLPEGEAAAEVSVAPAGEPLTWVNLPARNGTTYSVRLFGSEDRNAAENFVRQNLDFDWVPEPVILELPSEIQSNFRILAGEYQGRSAAVTAARELRAREELGYAQQVNMASVGGELFKLDRSGVENGDNP